MVRGKLKKWGGSLGVVIDAAEVRKRGLREGMLIEFEPRPAGLTGADIAGVLRDVPPDILRKVHVDLERDEGWHD